MTLPKRLLAQFNTPNSVIIITPFPEKGATYGRGIGGLASFAKNIIVPVAQQNKNTGKKVIILTHKINNRAEYYEEHGMLVVRCFDRNTFALYQQILKTLRAFDQVHNVSIQFEFAAYGGFLIASLFPLLVYTLTAHGKRVSLILHQVVLDLNSLSGHLGFKQKPVLTFVFNFLLRMYYLLICHFAQTVVVLEENLKERLSTLLPHKHIVSIPHGVDIHRKHMSKKNARQVLGLSQDEVVLIAFGYLTWYKGSDILLETLPKIQAQFPKKKVSMILAGGPSETQSDKPHYQEFLKKLENLQATYPHIQITGFIPEKEIAAYYAAADLVLFPYRTCMSSSGPLSLSYTYARPFLLSQALAEILTAADYQKGLAEVGLSKKDVLHSLTPTNFAKQIVGTLKSKKIHKLENLARYMQTARNYETLAVQYESLFFADTEENHHWSIKISRLAKFVPQLTLPILSIFFSKVIR